MNIWEILEIEPTRDLRLIKKAYARLLRRHNPEEDPGGFMRLREAYESACEMAGSEWFGAFAARRETSDRAAEESAAEELPPADKEAAREALDRAADESAAEEFSPAGEESAREALDRAADERTTEELPPAGKESAREALDRAADESAAEELPPAGKESAWETVPRALQALYDDFSSRISPEKWRTLFESFSLDEMRALYAGAAGFFNAYPCIPQTVWRFLEDELELTEDPSFMWADLLNEKLDLCGDLEEAFDRDASWDYAAYAELRLQAYVSFQSGAPAETLRYAEEAEVLLPWDTALLLRLKGDSRYELRNYREAAEAYTLYLQQCPAADGARFNLADSLMREKEYRSALSEFQLLKTRGYRPEDLPEKLWFCMLKAGQIPSAVYKFLVFRHKYPRRFVGALICFLLVFIPFGILMDRHISAPNRVETEPAALSPDQTNPAALSPEEAIRDELEREGASLEVEAERARWYLEMALGYDPEIGDTPDPERAFSLATRAAEMGDARAQNLLGIYYETGVGTEQDYAAAQTWYRKSADQGYPGGFNDLGMMYLRGLGVPQNTASAIALFESAADKGLAVAKSNLGWIYAVRLDVERDIEKAVALQQEAIEAGAPEAMYRLGVWYEQGELLPQDLDRAIRYYESAAELGLSDAWAGLAHVYESSGDLKKALPWYQKAADAGLAAAQTGLGRIYKTGLVIPQDYERAARLFTEAAAGGDSEAMYHLAFLYVEGLGVSRDFARAEECFDEAVRMRLDDEIFEAEIRGDAARAQELSEEGMWMHDLLLLLDKSGGENLSGALYALARWCETEASDMEGAEKWYALAARSGSTEAERRLAAR
jgi:TPR repeat protein